MACWPVTRMCHRNRFPHVSPPFRRFEPCDSGAFYKMAEVETARAKTESFSESQRADHWREAMAWLRKCRDVFIDMGARELLAASDVCVPDEIAEEIISCGAELARLSHDDQ